jgi:sarcosine oxidase
MARVDFAVVGRGLMGTACARHLAAAGCSVALIGPDEPADPSRHDGPFGSFHDAGRITRAIAHDPVWSRLSTRSLSRYDALAAQTGITFYTPCGGLMAGPTEGPMAGFTAGFLETSAALGLPHDRLSGAALDTRFAMFDLPRGSHAAFDPVGGIIDPRAMRRAHEALAVADGARVIATHAISCAGTTLELADGSSLSAGHVVEATGGWAGAAPLSHARPAMEVYQRTVLLAEVSQTEAARLADMPSLIYVPEGDDDDLYVLPPIRYPDGKFYIKIGGEKSSPRACDGPTLNAWFKTRGSPEAGAVLCAALRVLMPDLSIAGTVTAPCAVSFTATGYPYIAKLDAQTTMLTGGNGSAAKNADELGRLGAVAALGGSMAAEGLGTDFAPAFV